MTSLEIRNQKIIDAVLEKERKLCPGAIALIGIYGSFLTGAVHPLSDLDLLILINDERGWQLGTAFIQDDLGVGHDIYCTSWESLRRDAQYEHPHIAKLMDSRIVYCADEQARTELENLREQVRKTLESPLSEADIQRAENGLKQAQCAYAAAMTALSLTDTRRQAGGVLYYLESAIAMLNKTYFRLGARRRLEELSAMTRTPENLSRLTEQILSAGTPEALKDALTQLMRAAIACFRTARNTAVPEKRPADADALRGTYEEMFSNWHGKMSLAAETGNRHLAFMSLVNADAMISEISGRAEISEHDALSVYDPQDLSETSRGFDRFLQDYLTEYQKAGLRPACYPDVDAFLSDYMKNS